MATECGKGRTMSADLSDILLHTPPLKLWLDERMGQEDVLSSRADNYTIEKMMPMPGLEEFCDGPSNQRRVSSCTTHLLVNALELLRNRYYGKKSGLRLSPEGAYNAFRERFDLLDKDSGMTMFQLRVGAKRVGVVPMSVWAPTSPYIPPPAQYDAVALKFPGRWSQVPMANASVNGQIIEDKDWYLRRILYRLKVERLPIGIATKVPLGDLRSTSVARNGIRSASPYKSSQDEGYWHAECMVNMVYIGGEIYAKVIGSWGNRGDKGFFYIPWETALSEPLYAAPALAPDEGWS